MTGGLHTSIYPGYEGSIGTRGGEGPWCGWREKSKHSRQTGTPVTLQRGTDLLLYLLRVPHTRHSLSSSGSRETLVSPLRLEVPSGVPSACPPRGPK